MDYNINKKVGVIMCDVEQTIREINESMAIEGMPPTEDDKNRMRDVLYERVSMEEAVRRLKERYTVKTVQLGN